LKRIDNPITSGHKFSSPNLKKLLARQKKMLTMKLLIEKDVSRVQPGKIGFEK